MTMSVVVPESVPEVLDAWSEHHDATLLAGGTDLMVDVNFARRRPGSIIALRRVASLRAHDTADQAITIGAGVTYSELQQPALADPAPALAQAARTVGSPQIRNAGTIGGNLGTASPAGDTLPVLLALDAVVEVAGPGGRRDVAVADFLAGPKRTTLRQHELVTAVRIPRVRGAQEFLKVGTRNAMVIATVSLALVRDDATRTVRVGLGAVGPVPLRAPAAEGFADEHLDWEHPDRRLDPDVAAAFADLVADAARPIDDHRSTADYRRHAVRVLARRALERVWGRRE
jgi:CO/xanthine dehydrogenase FAD-binding subunit